MAALFRVQGRSVIKEFVRFKRHFVEAGIDSAVDAMLDDALKITIPEMTKDFAAVGLQGYEWGYADLATNLGLQDAFSLAHPEAVQWANERAAVRVSGVDDTTKGQIRNLISHGLEEGDSYGEVQRSIKRQFEQFAVGSPLEHIQSRAELVAVTEMGEAYEAGAATLSDELEAYGIDQEKARAGPSDERTSDACLADLDVGWIPKDEAFPSGIMSGLEHPGCRHGTLYRVAREKGPEGPPAQIAAKQITSEQWAKQLSAPERSTLELWQQLGYKEVRAYELTGKIGSPATKQMSQYLNQALDKAPMYDGTVYRGLANLSDETFRAIVEKQTISLEATSSASTKRWIAEKFARKSTKGNAVVLEIRNKTGVNISNVSLSRFRHEGEVIMRKDSKYRVISIVKQKERPWTVARLEEIV